jgi:hypothetical protein
MRRNGLLPGTRPQHDHHVGRLDLRNKPTAGARQSSGWAQPPDGSERDRSRQDGIVQHDDRALGRVDIGGLPAGITSPPRGGGVLGIAHGLLGLGQALGSSRCRGGDRRRHAYWATGYERESRDDARVYLSANWTQTVTQTFTPASKRMG